MRKQFITIQTVLIMVASMHLISCRASNETDGTSLFTEVSTKDGTVIDNATAINKINAYCGEQLLPYMAKISGRVDFQAGYDSTFSGSGYSYQVEMKNGIDGREAYVRANEGQMYITNGNGMRPPSEGFRHEGLMNAECEVSLRSLAGKSGFEKVEATAGASLSGGTAYATVNATDCVSVKMLSQQFGTKHNVVFCPQLWFQESTTSGSGADSREQMVIQPKA